MNDEKWHEVSEGRVVHGYDGWSIRMETRSVFGLLSEKLWEELLMAVGDPCSGKGIWGLANKIFGERAEIFAWSLENFGVKWSWKLFRPRNFYHYPVSDQWVAHYRPELLEWDILPDPDDEKDPDWGTKCPVCEWGRVNDPNDTWIEAYGKCFQCALRDDATYDSRP